jgi:hypothetical protein
MPLVEYAFENDVNVVPVGAFAGPGCAPYIDAGATLERTLHPPRRLP